MRKVYAKALFLDTDATLDDLREAVTTLEEIERNARRVLGGGNPVTVDVEAALWREIKFPGRAAAARSGDDSTNASARVKHHVASKARRVKVHLHAGITHEHRLRRRRARRRVAHADAIAVSPRHRASTAGPFRGRD